MVISEETSYMPSKNGHETLADMEGYRVRWLHLFSPVFLVTRYGAG